MDPSDGAVLFLVAEDDGASPLRPARQVLDLVLCGAGEKLIRLHGHKYHSFTDPVNRVSMIIAIL